MSSLRVRADAAAQVLTTDLERLDLDEDQTQHLARSLRLRDGEDVVACNGAGSWRRCIWRGSSRGGVLEAVGPIVVDDEVSPPVTVWLPELKGARTEWAVTKLTELGVSRIGLLRCDRAVVRLDDEAAAKVLARWARLAREATCQSRRTRLPELLGPGDVDAAVSTGAVRCDLDAARVPDADCTSLAVGPEGGWSASECAASPSSVRVGDTVLRTETAAVAAGVWLRSLARAARSGPAGVTMGTT